MTDGGLRQEIRRNRWLPAAVVSIFSLMFLADAVVIILYGNYRNLIEQDGVDVVFTPADHSVDMVSSEALKVADGLRVVAADGTILVESVAEQIRILVPGNLVFRFRAPDAGRYVELGYRFGKRKSRARCEIALARVASRHGVDYMCRRSFAAKKKPRGKFRHFLADHAGWFELSVEVNPEAAKIGFEVTKPSVVPE